MGNISQTIERLLMKERSRLIIIEDAIKKVETSESLLMHLKKYSIK